MTCVAGQSFDGDAEADTKRNGSVFKVTVCGAVVTLPCESVAFQVIVVTPTLKAAASGCPSLRVDVTVTVPHVSLAVAVPVLTTFEQDGHEKAVTLGGTVIVGGTESTTVIVCVAEAWFPCVSVPVQVMVVVPIG
jgi:hypothetical protein